MIGVYEKNGVQRASSMPAKLDSPNNKKWNEFKITAELIATLGKARADHDRFFPQKVRQPIYDLISDVRARPSLPELARVWRSTSSIKLMN
mmetsp:Transcript_31257/g.50173  ORF Transcript_31257/g.50173 Transcript_31257/m.50173 type:complete len:91 (+) Transcript_31257:188-460(+)